MLQAMTWTPWPMCLSWEGCTTLAARVCICRRSMGTCRWWSACWLLGQTLRLQTTGQKLRAPESSGLYVMEYRQVRKYWTTLLSWPHSCCLCSRMICYCHVVLSSLGIVEGCDKVELPADRNVGGPCCNKYSSSLGQPHNKRPMSGFPTTWQHHIYVHFCTGHMCCCCLKGVRPAALRCRGRACCDL